MKFISILLFILFSISCEVQGSEDEPKDSKDTEQNLESGAAAVESGDYQSAIEQFKAAISTATEPKHISAAYTGLGFSQLRIETSGSENNAYSSLESALTQNTTPEVLNQAKSIKTLMDFAYKKNYLEAIRLANEVFSSDSNFVFTLDKNIDIKDVIIHKALSEFALKKFDDCYQSILKLDPNYPNPQKMEQELRKKLEELIDQYN